jgi:hypothetical protein
MPPPDSPLGPDERELRAVRSAGTPGGPSLGGPDRIDADEMALRRLGGVARSLTGEDALVDVPPPDVWDAIAARTWHLAASDTVAPALAARQADDEDGGRARWLWLAAAAAVAVVVAGFTVGVWSRDADPGRRLLASARLDPLDGGDPVGPVGPVGPVDAELVESDDGLLLDLRLADADLPTPDGHFYEVWLVDPAGRGTISLGPARDDDTYSVPADLDHHDFAVVEVTVEPTDGDPAPSGVTVLRGTLSG